MQNPTVREEAVTLLFLPRRQHSPNFALGRHCRFHLTHTLWCVCSNFKWAKKHRLALWVCFWCHSGGVAWFCSCGCPEGKSFWENTVPVRAPVSPPPPPTSLEGDHLWVPLQPKPFCGILDVRDFSPTLCVAETNVCIKPWGVRSFSAEQKMQHKINFFFI